MHVLHVRIPHLQKLLKRGLRVRRQLHLHTAHGAALGYAPRSHGRAGSGEDAGRWARSGSGGGGRARVVAGQRCVGRAGRRAGRAWAGDAGGQARGGAAAHAVEDILLVELEDVEHRMRDRGWSRNLHVVLVRRRSRSVSGVGRARLLAVERDLAEARRRRAVDQWNSGADMGLTENM